MDPGEGPENLARIHAAAVLGVQAVPVEVEVNVTGSKDDKFQPSIVGLPDAAVRESLDRVTTALVNSGLSSPTNSRWLVNLVPSSFVLKRMITLANNQP